LFTFNSGHPYTLAQPSGLAQAEAWTGALVGADTRNRVPAGPINSSTTPWNFNLDMRIDKNVTIMNVNVDFYVYASNLLNTKNVINIYDHTGNAYDDGFLGTTDAQKIMLQPRYTQRFGDLYRALNLQNREHSFRIQGNDVFGTPRQLRAGVLINF
jgi:hypothetical protein